MWNPKSIDPHIKTTPAWTVYRLQPAERLLANDVLDSDQERDLLSDLTRGQRQVSSAGLNLAWYDDEIAFVFKHPQVQGASRFSRPNAHAGTLYAAEQHQTALAECAFHLLRTYKEQGGTVVSGHVPITQIAFDLDSALSVDLSLKPFAQDTQLRTPSTGYAYTQDFADVVRQTVAQQIIYPSVRCLNHGVNVALLDHGVLATQRLDHRRMRDWFVRCDPSTRTVTAQTTQGTTHHFRFDPNGRPI